jgi:hypothetical protein
MRIRSICTVLLLCALALTPLTANRAAAQSSSSEKLPLYTYVSEWTVPRALWADYVKGEAADTDILKKAIADGTIVAYGNYTVITHQEGLPTHGTWFSSNSLAGVLKVLETVRTAPGAVAPPLAAAKHWDYLMESHNYKDQSGTFTNAYLRVGHWLPKEGISDPGGKVLKASMVPMLDKLVSDGALYGYQIDMENVHSGDPGTIFLAIIANGGEGLDKFGAALEEAEKNDPAVWAGMSSTLNQTGHRDFLARVNSMTHK